MSKKMNILVIHHSHTDIGYTDRQEKIQWHHIKYIERVIDILNDAYKNNKKEYQSFKWVCESYWCVERFLEQTTDQYKKDFVKYVKFGNIGVSGNYLNCTDILDETVMRDTMNKCMKQIRELDIDVHSSMTADINGYSWGYPQVLIDSGIQNLLSCVHTHHGYHATNKKQRPFYWQTPSGDKLLVWHGDHYHLGCEFVMNHAPQFEYMIRDGLSKEGISNEEFATKRLYRYVENLREENYPYDFVPITVSGLTTDNSPPNEKIIDFINDWNEKHGDDIHIEMVTLDELFNRVRSSDVPIETFSGDWTDWWADGVISTPNVIKHYREAVRKYNMVKQLDPDYKIVNKDLMEKARYYLMFYSEHTWGFSSSLSEPWHAQVNNLDMRKSMYAGIAHEAVSFCYDQLCEANGETAYILNKDYYFYAINPNSVPIKTVSRIGLETMFHHKYFDIIDETTGKAVPYQHDFVARGHEFDFVVELNPHERKKFRIAEKEPLPLKTTGMYADGGCDGVDDFASFYDKDPDFKATPYYLETPFFKMSYQIGDGITELIDKQKNVSLLRTDREFNAFTPVYEVTPFLKDPCLDRRDMGRNRKSLRTQRYSGKLINVVVEAYGEVFSRIKLSYELKGTSMCDLILTAYRHTPRIDVALRLNKESVWEPENLYVSLPFTTGEKETLYIDKLGCLIRPRIDQLPGSCGDFYAVQNGIALIGENKSLLLTLTDAPMITMGTVQPHPIKLCGEDGMNNNDIVYSWVMNNFWETNFKASLAGFQEYCYTLKLTDTTNPVECFEHEKAINNGMIQFYSFE